MNINGNDLGNYNMNVSANQMSGVGGFTRAASDVNNLTQATIDSLMSKEGGMPVEREVKQSLPSEILNRAWLPSSVNVSGKAELAAILRAFPDKTSSNSASSSVSSTESSQEVPDRKSLLSDLGTCHIALQLAGKNYMEELSLKEQDIVVSRGVNSDPAELQALLGKLKPMMESVLPQISESFEYMLNNSSLPKTQENTAALEGLKALIKGK